MQNSIEKTAANNTKLLYSYDKYGKIEGEITEENAYTYYRGTELIGCTSNSGDRLYYVQDRHGNVTALLNEDGTEKKTYAYNPYGKEEESIIYPMGSKTAIMLWRLQTETPHNPFRYCGEYYDDETDLIYLRNRYYDNQAGRFITEDPIKDSINWYVYCGNNPVNHIDPWGLIPTVKEAAAMAEHIYKDIPLSDPNDREGNLRERTVAGWRLIDIYSKGSFKMGVYIRDGDDWRDPSEYCLVSRGTTNAEGSGNDWDDNLLQPLGASGDMKLSLNTAKWFSDNHFQEITFVGHSKGGGEAMANAVATNRNAITFNPAKANLTTYSKTKYARKSYTGTMTHYVVRGEILNNKFGDPSMGTTVKLPTQVPIQAWTWDAWRQRIDNHHMWAVKAALEKEGY